MQKVPQLGLIMLDLVNDCHPFSNSVSRVAVRIQTGDMYPVVVQARKNGHDLVSYTLLMPGDLSLYIMNDSDSHIQRKDGMVVTMEHEALHMEEVSAADELLTNGNGRSALENMSNGSFHLDGIIDWRDKIIHCQ